MHMIHKFNYKNALVKVFNEDTQPDFDYGNEEENLIELTRFDSGELQHVLIEVSVWDKSNLVIGTDILGGCFINSNKFEQDVIQTIEYNEMIFQAKEDLNQKLKEIIEANA